MQNTTLSVVIALAIFSASCVKQKPKTDKPVIVSLDSLIVSEHQAKRFDGTLVIGTKDSIIYQKAIGIANRVWDIPMQMNHRFDICSINKSFVATLVMKAVEEKRLSLDSHLSDYLKTYSYSGSFNSDITIHQVLTHTSGLPDYAQVAEVYPELFEDLGRMFKRKHFSTEEYVDFISNLPTIGNPGEQFYYSNFGYHLLTVILEKLYQQSFSALLDQKICQPLSLENTFSTASNRDIYKRIVEGYNYEGKTDSWKRNRFIDFTIGQRISSTAYDLYLWGKEMNPPSLLDANSAALMQTNYTKNVNDDISYGYGWAVFDGQGDYQMGNIGIDRKYIIHGGNTEGYKSMLINIENGTYIIAFLANTGEQTNELELAGKIASILIQE